MQRKCVHFIMHHCGIMMSFNIYARYYHITLLYKTRRYVSIRKTIHSNMFLYTHDKWPLIYESFSKMVFGDQTAWCLHCIWILCSKKQLYKWCTTGYARYTYVCIHKINVNMCKCSCTCIYVVPWDLLFAEHIYTSICYLVNCHVVPTYGMCSYFLHICVRTKTRADTFTKTTSCCICFGDLFIISTWPPSAAQSI